MMYNSGLNLVAAVPLIPSTNPEALGTHDTMGFLSASITVPDQGGTLVLLGAAILGLFVLANRLRR